VPRSATVNQELRQRSRERILAAALEVFAAKAKVLKDLVEHHAEEEETEMFPRARKLMDREELVRLGDQLAQAKVSLTERVLTKLVELVRP